MNRSKYPSAERDERNKAKASEWRAANKDRLREYMAGWRENNRQHMRDSAARWRAANPKRWRGRVLLKKYGMNLEGFRDLLVGQAGRCLICDLVPLQDLVVDHNHMTGTVRGLLCQKCNRMLGHVSDRVDILQSAVRYLELGR